MNKVVFICLLLFSTGIFSCTQEKKAFSKTIITPIEIVINFSTGWQTVYNNKYILICTYHGVDDFLKKYPNARFSRAMKFDKELDIAAYEINRPYDDIQIIPIHPTLKSEELFQKNLYFVKNDGKRYNGKCSWRNTKNPLHTVPFFTLKANASVTKELMHGIHGNSGTPIFWNGYVVGILIGYIEGDESINIEGIKPEDIRSFLQKNFSY